MSRDTVHPTPPHRPVSAPPYATPDPREVPLLDIFRVIRALLVLLLDLGQPLRVFLLQPLITVCVLLALYAGWHIRDEGSIAAGLHVAFVDTRAFRAEHLRELEAALLQNELHQAAQTDRLIDQLLTTLLQHAPTVARVRLDVVHNGVTGVTGTALLRYDVTNAVAGAGHSVGPLLTNQPLSDWNEFLPSLLAGKCQLLSVSQGVNIAWRARLEALGTGTVLVCPVVDIQARILGALFLQWDVRDGAPAGEQLDSLMTYARSIGLQIASALDLRTPMGLPIGLESTD